MTVEEYLREQIEQRLDDLPTCDYCDGIADLDDLRYRLKPLLADPEMTPWQLEQVRLQILRLHDQLNEHEESHGEIESRIDDVIDAAQPVPDDDGPPAAVKLVPVPPPHAQEVPQIVN